MRVQPAGRSDAGDRGGDGDGNDEGCAGCDGRGPEAGEGRAGYGGLGAQEAEEDGVLEEGEAEGGGGGAEREDEAEVCGFGLEDGHGLRVGGLGGGLCVADGFGCLYKYVGSVGWDRQQRFLRATAEYC